MRLALTCSSSSPLLSHPLLPPLRCHTVCVHVCTMNQSMGKNVPFSPQKYQVATYKWKVFCVQLIERDQESSKLRASTSLCVCVSGCSSSGLNLCTRLFYLESTIINHASSALLPLECTHCTCKVQLLSEKYLGKLS